MKKIFALILCLMLLCATPLVAFAEGEEVAEDTTVTEEETVPEQEEIIPEQEEIVPEETEPEPAPAPEEETGTDWNEIKDTLSGAFVEWIEPNLEEIGVIVALFGYGIAVFKKLANVLKSLGIMNNNTITISKENANLMEQAMSSIETASSTVTAWDVKIAQILAAYQQTAEDKQRLENELVEIKNYLKTSTDANVEFANELAELLGLANIPNYKKEEIGARHLESVKAIIEAEKKAEAALLPASTEEVKEIVGEEKKD